MHEGAHGFQIVIDPLEQHRLRAQGDTRVGQHGAGAIGFGGAFIRVGEMQAHPQRVILAQHANQSLSDALGQHRRHFGADAHDLHVGNLAESGQHPGEFFFSQHQRVAAAEDDVGGVEDGGDGGFGGGVRGPERRGES